ncbi:hypothetical protein AMATHDRAFT_67511 [Amanita thiersii Skay4041]|uniref:Natural resistance-associated macrophage protein n=1 Tax=Amanita thiersii Skay4041 TaxID=703135 RepID=A0A2A9NIR3_9AGAR|nr:hypothetical protein AMATHDRAFT_67511 [Amanita thiersii Skay4041]
MGSAIQPSDHSDTQQFATRRHDRPSDSYLRRVSRTVLYHAKKHTGVGIVCAVAYFDPGNWGVDLQAGSRFGYRLLFVILLAGIFAVFLQVLASRLGCVTGLDLATHCRLLLHDRPKHTRLFRWGCLYPLYALSEVAIIATDLAELLGSAIALVLLFPKLELWHGVLLTGIDVIFLLAMGDPLRGTPVRMFELLIAGLVLAVLICMVIIISEIHVDWSDAFLGYVPSKYIFRSGGLYTSVGILGATVMPHSIFLGSALATQDRISYRRAEEMPQRIESDSTVKLVQTESSQRSVSFLRRYFDGLKESFWRAIRIPEEGLYSTAAKRHNEHKNNPFGFVAAHIYHGVADVVISLLGFAVVINSLILILASAVFYYGSGSSRESGDPASLFDAYDLIRDLVGQGAATLFAIALLAAGQSSSIIATVAGQAVSEGFLQWRVSPVIRRLLTRLLAIVPSMIVAVAAGKQGIDSLLVASQVVLSMALPFITFPLIYLTSSKSVMSVSKPRQQRPAHIEDFTSPEDTCGATCASGAGAGVDSIPVTDTNSVVQSRDVDQPDLENAGDEKVDFSNSRFTFAIGMVIWFIVVVANVYVLIDLARGGEH